MVYLVATIAALLLVFCGWQLWRERQRRLHQSKPIGARNRG